MLHETLCHSQSVLLIGEELGVRARLARALFPHLVIFTNSFENALKILKRSTIDLVLLNDRKEVRSMNDFMSRVNINTSPPRVIVLFGRQLFDKQLYSQAGVHRCFDKQLGLKQLAECLLRELAQVFREKSMIKEKRNDFQETEGVKPSNGSLPDYLRDGGDGPPGNITAQFELMENGWKNRFLPGNKAIQPVWEEHETAGNRQS
jgi:DNA-binding NtrC family response regulator